MTLRLRFFNNFSSSEASNKSRLAAHGLLAQRHGLECQVAGEVCVYLSSSFKGQCFTYAIPIAKSYPPMTSLPHLGLVVLPLQNPGGGLAGRVSN